jgi:hypothetical protein
MLRQNLPYRFPRTLWALAPHAPQQAGAAPCTPVGAVYGRFANRPYPKPLEIEVFFGAEFCSIMPLPRYSGAICILK